MRFYKNNIIFQVLYETGITYRVPSNLSYLWNFGFLAIFCYCVQVFTGIFLAMHYVPNADLAFNSVEHIMRDVQYGWLIRYIHANGASAFFFVIYYHIGRGLYYNSYAYPRIAPWLTGVIIFLLMIITAFLGYVLPWGQMSFWAATVITNLASAIPFIGNDVVIWLWGGFSVDNATLNRFFSLHYLLPFIMLGLIFLHIVFLHEVGSNNPLGTLNWNLKKSTPFTNKLFDKLTYLDVISFSPYLLIKDLLGLIFFLLCLIYFIFYIPNYLGHSDNYIAANPLVTPAHIVPEWYFLPFFAILRSVPDKLLGVILLLLSILVLLIIPFLPYKIIYSNQFKIIHKLFFWIFIFNFIALGWIGSQAIESPTYEIGQLCTLYYFLYFLLIIPILDYLEFYLYSNYY
jgi:ubiquinol-cytochrome c reductase cytochrome b subunit